MHAVTLVTTLLLLISLPIATATDGLSAPVHVDLIVHTDQSGEAGFEPGDPDPLVGTARCAVTVPSGSNAGDVLDQAVEAGCILEWDYAEFEGEHFVNSVDGLRAVDLTCLAWPVACQWWEFQVNGASAGFGIDGYSAVQADQVGFFFHTA